MIGTLLGTISVLRLVFAAPASSDRAHGKSSSAVQALGRARIRKQRGTIQISR
jgi:hypothetical protein